MDALNMLFVACIVAAAVCFLVGMFVTSSGAYYGAVIASYVFVCMGVLSFLVKFFYRLQNGNNGGGGSSSNVGAVIASGPFACILGIVGYALYLYVVYQTPIQQGHVSSSFATYSGALSLLLFLQLSLYIHQAPVIGYMPTSTVTSIMYFLTLLCAIVEYIMTVILKYYTTDG